MHLVDRYAHGRPAGNDAMVQWFPMRAYVPSASLMPVMSLCFAPVRSLPCGCLSLGCALVVLGDSSHASPLDASSSLSTKLSSCREDVFHRAHTLNYGACPIPSRPFLVPQLSLFFLSFYSCLPASIRPLVGVYSTSKSYRQRQICQYHRQVVHFCRLNCFRSANRSADSIGKLTDGFSGCHLRSLVAWHRFVSVTSHTLDFTV